MNETWNWDDARLFLAVARSGGLSGAVSVTRVSAPTLGRRMSSLERSLGVQLFARHRNGYELTASGKEFLELCNSLELGALDIERWRFATEADPVVRIAAGTWTSTFLARHISSLTGAAEKLAIEIVSGAGDVDLLRREANLGLRNRRPVATGLAGRRLVEVNFAVYGEKSYVRQFPEALDDRRYTDCQWIAYSPSGPRVPSSVWLSEKISGDAQIKCSTAQAMLEATAAKAGLCVLPCFIGDSDTRLARASEIVRELQHHQWLVTHDDDRRIPHIAEVSKRLAKLIRSHESLFRG